MPEAWYKLVTKSTITREDYPRDSQAVLDALQFYTDRQKREMEELGLYPNSRPGTSGNTLSPSMLSPYPQTSSAPRFNAGMGLGGIENTSLDSRPALPQPPPTISPVTTNLQANRPAPPRPLLTTNRPAPPTPRQRISLQDYTPSSADLLAGTKAQGSSIDHSPKPPGLGTGPPARKESWSERDREGEQELRLRQRKLRERKLRERKLRELDLQELEVQEFELRLHEQQERKQRERERDLEREQREKERRPQIATPESSPATTNPITYPILKPVTRPPPVKPLQPVKKTAIPAVTVTQPGEGGEIEATAAALWINDLQEGKNTGLPPSPPSNRADRDRKRPDPDGFPGLQNTNNPNGMSSVSWRPSSSKFHWILCENSTQIYHQKRMRSFPYSTMRKDPGGRQTWTVIKLRSMQTYSMRLAFRT